LSDSIHARAKTGRTFAVMAGFVALISILILTFNVTREMKLLGSATSDNIQWALAQTQVEFLEFSQELTRAPVSLGQLRQEFDVFYSRMTTVRRATVFAELRDDPVSRGALSEIVAFLDNSVPLIDADDDRLLSGLPELVISASKIAPRVRKLANSGLNIFAQSADKQRNAVSQTMTQLAIALATLISTLAIGLYYLNRLNHHIHRREREQNQTAMRMKTITDTALDGVIVCDADGLILEFSPAAEAIFGHSEEDVLGKNVSVLIVPADMLEAHYTGMARLRALDDLHVIGKGRVQTEAMRSDGETFPIELAIQAATTDQGEIFVAFLRDISARVAADAELVAALDKALASEKMKTDFLATMSHEIRTPFNGLLGNMNLLRDTKLTADQDRYVGHMETSGRLLMNHISDVLDITRYDAGKLDTRCEPMNISALLQDIVDTQGSTASKNGTSLDWGWTGQKIDWILSDHDKLLHVMMNLIGNAVKFTKDGRVAVMVQNVGGAGVAELLLKVSDTGPGIAEELVDRVFDDFVTGDTAYDREGSGTGLGLSIAQRFVIALGGEIGVDSVVSEGSTFWVRLPVTQAQVPVVNDAVIAPLPASALHVLLVEDNAINRIVAGEMLQADGHTVVEAHNGKQGAEMSKATEFDLILMDISMPVMDGRVATRLIRSEGGASTKSPIVALTANANAEEQEWFMQDGMNAILTKPLSREALRRLVEDVAANPAISAVTLINQTICTEARDALGEEIFVKLMSQFLDEMDELHAQLKSDDNLDFADVAAQAHKVAGSAAIFGADGLRERLKSVEIAAKAGDSPDLRKLIRGLDSVWEITKNELSP
jgi:PAS domain S-box-containing protein